MRLDRLSNPHFDALADSPGGLVKQKCSPQGHAHVADELEQPAVLPGEMHGHDGAAFDSGKLCREGCPGEVHGWPAQRRLAKRNTSTGENSDCMPRPEPHLRLAA